MRRPAASDVLFWLLAPLSALALATLALALAGGMPIEDAPESEPAAAPAPSVSTRTRTPASTQPETLPRTAPRAKTAPPPTSRPRPARAVVVVTATRGDSWVSARAGSESGELLDERLLQQGESLQLQAPRVWLSLGAAGNVDVTVNGELRSLGNGTIASVLAPDATEPSSGAG